MTYDPDVPDEVRAAFAAGPGAEPPLTLAVDDVLTAGRAVRRKRRGTLTAVASGLSVVAVVTAVTIGTLGAGPGSPPLADGTGDGPVPCTTELPPRRR